MMSKRLWFLAALVVLGAGAMTVKNRWWTEPPLAAIPRPAEPRPVEPVENAFPPAAPASTPTAPAEFVVEPIVTRIEPLQDLREPMGDLPLATGVGESAAAATQKSRPDLESRRMPYADDADQRHESRNTKNE